MERPPHILRHQSEFPNFSALRDSFAARLDAVIRSNTAMLLDRLATRYDPPLTDAILEVAGTGAVEKPARRPGELEIVGEVDGVRIKVIVKANGDVRTTYPINDPGVEKNPVE